MFFDELFPLQVYINLDSRPDRKQQVLKEFEKIGLIPERISGTFIKGTNNNMINGMMGCTFSHLRALLLAKERKQNIFIFEDDAMFINDYEEIIKSSFLEIQKYDWTFLYLGANILRPFTQVSPYLAKLTHAQSTCAYGVNYKYIDVVLTHILLNQTEKGRVRPIDTIYADIIIPQYNCFITAPKMTIVQRDGLSDIEGREVNYESYLEERYNKNIIRLEDK